MKKIALKTLNEEQLQLKEKLINYENKLKEALEVIDTIVDEEEDTFFDTESSAEVLVSMFLNNVCITIDQYINPEKVTE